MCKLADTNDVPVNKVNCNIVDAIERLQRDFRQRVAKIRSILILDPSQYQQSKSC